MRFVILSVNDFLIYAQFSQKRIGTHWIGVERSLWTIISSQRASQPRLSVVSIKSRIKLSFRAFKPCRHVKMRWRKIEIVNGLASNEVSPSWVIRHVHSTMMILTLKASLVSPTRLDKARSEKRRNIEPASSRKACREEIIEIIICMLNLCH